MCLSLSRRYSWQACLLGKGSSSSKSTLVRVIRPWGARSSGLITCFPEAVVPWSQSSQPLTSGTLQDSSPWESVLSYTGAFRGSCLGPRTWRLDAEESLHGDSHSNYHWDPEDMRGWWRGVQSHPYSFPETKPWAWYHRHGIHALPCPVLIYYHPCWMGHIASSRAKLWISGCALRSAVCICILQGRSLGPTPAISSLPLEIHMSLLPN